MFRLLTATGVSIFLAVLIECRDRELMRQRWVYKERLVTCLLIIFLSFFCGLRTWGNDTVTYKQIFELTPTLDEYTLDTFASGMGFGLMVSLIKTLGATVQDYLLIFAFITIFMYVGFVRRFADNFVFSIFLMFATGMYTFTLAAIKQCVATGICLMALPAALDGRWRRFLGLILLAMLFHPYSAVYLAVPFLMFKPWTRRTLLYVVLTMGVSWYLESLLGTVLDVTTMMGAEYTEASFSGEGVNVFRVAVASVPMLMAMLYGKPLFRDTEPEEDLMFNLAMMNALIMFVGLFGTANYFARLANYFLPAQVIVLPWLLNRTAPVDRTWLKPACVLGYLTYFYYEYGILHPFDGEYSQISIWSYLGDLWGRLT